MNLLSTTSFSAIIFRDGKRVAGCHIRLGGGFSSDGIAYSASENASANSFNELLAVETDQHLMCLKATMGMFHGNRDFRLNGRGSRRASVDHVYFAASTISAGWAGPNSTDGTPIALAARKKNANENRPRFTLFVKD
jgi:hypothetical protein